MATAGMIYWLWPRVGLPPHGEPLDAPFPGLWRWFFATWLPALFPVYTLLHRLLASRSEAGSGPPASPGARGDRLSYLALPTFLVLEVCWKLIGEWRVPFAAFYVGLLGVKTFGLLLALSRVVAPVTGEPSERADRNQVGWFLFLTALATYVFLVPYVATSISTAGDEHKYLLSTYSLYVDGDLDVRNNLEQRDYRSFYWGGTTGTMHNRPFSALPLLLFPGYALLATLLPQYPVGGRIGAALTISGLASLMALQTYRLCRDLGASRLAAFWTWLVAAFTPPVLVHSGHLYPEIPAALAIVVGARAALRVPDRVWSPLICTVGAAALTVAMKDRFAVAGLGLLLWALIGLTSRRPRLGGLLVVAGLASIALIWRYNPMLGVFPRFPDLGRLLTVPTTLAVYRFMGIALLGMFADQEFGLLYYAPQWSLALLGLGLLWRRNPGATAALLGTALFYLLLLVRVAWTQWDAGWTPPPRFPLAITPLLAPFVAETFDRCRGRALAAVNTVWFCWTSLAAFFLSLVPFWRYNDLDGRSTLLQVAGDQLGLDFARFLPSVRSPTPWTWAILASGGLLGLALAIRVVWRPPSPPAGREARTMILSPLSALGLCALLASLWTALALVVPTSSVEAEGMRHSTGIRFGSFQHEDILWVMKKDGTLSDPIVTWSGVTEIGVTAGGYTTTGSVPQMTLLMGGDPVASWRLETGDGQWVRAEYTTRLRTRFGRSRLELRIAGLLDRPREGRVQHAYVDRVRVQWLGRDRDVTETPSFARER